MYQQKDLKAVNLLRYNMFEVKWHVTKGCNYKCPYCIQGSDHSGFLSEDVVIERAKKIHNLVKNKNKGINLEALGGEVCFYNGPKILENMPLVKRVFMTTNFSNTIEYFQQLYDYCDSKQIELSLLCSYHETGDEFFEKFLILAKWCNEREYKAPSLTFVVDNNFDFTIFDRFPELVNFGLDFFTKLYLDGSATELSKKTRDNIALIKARPKTLELSKPKYKYPQPKYLFEMTGNTFLSCRQSDLFREFKEGYIIPNKFYCDAGINSIAIFPDGTIARCDNDCASLGHIDSSEEIVLKSSKCTADRCLLCQPVRMIRTWDSPLDPFIVK